MKFFVALLALAAVAFAEPAAEADPALLYSALGYNFGHPLAYSGYAPFAAPAYRAPLAYSGYSTYGYGLAHPLAAGYRLFKREAEAEADPAIFYNSLGYTYGHAAYTTPYAYSASYVSPYAAHVAPYAARAYSYGGYAPFAYGKYFF